MSVHKQVFEDSPNHEHWRFCKNCKKLKKFKDSMCEDCKWQITFW
jgi:hypothetical protein